MAELKQSENAFAKYLIWYGSCDTDANVEFNVVNANVIQKVVEYTENAINVKIFDRLSDSLFWEITKLKPGHAYEITLARGNSSIEIPSAVVSYHELNVVKKITTYCSDEATPTPKKTTPTPTQTPTPSPTSTPTPEAPTPTPFDCCANQKSVTLDNDAYGVSLQKEGEGFENAQLCFELVSDDPVEPSNSTDSYYLKTHLNEYIGLVGITSKEGLSAYKGFSENTNGRFVYKLPNGDCYEGDLEFAEPNDWEKAAIFTKIQSEQMLDDEIYTTPTSASYYYLATPTPQTIGNGLDPSLDFSVDEYGGTLLVAGNNNYGKLATDADTESFEPSYIPSNSIFSASRHHFVYVTSSGTMHGGGLALHGQLGDSDRLGTVEPSDSYEVILDENLTDIRDVLALGLCSFAIRSDDTLWAFGSNSGKQLGTGDDDSYTTHIAKKLPIENVLYFLRTHNAPKTSGLTTAYILNADGEIYAWGDNSNNNLLLGDSAKAFYDTPTKINEDHHDIISISLADNCTLVLKSDGRVYATGNIGLNGVGGIGISSDYETNQLMPISMSSENGNVIQNFKDVIDIYTNGKDSVVALKSDGTVYTWGVNESLLGVGDTREYNDGFSHLGENYPLPNRYSSRGRTIPTKVNISDVKSIKMTERCCYAVKTDGTLWVWGADNSGESGVKKNTVFFNPTQVTFDTHLSVSVESITCGKNSSYVKLDLSS